MAAASSSFAQCNYTSLVEPLGFFPRYSSPGLLPAKPLSLGSRKAPASTLLLPSRRQKWRCSSAMERSRRNEGRRTNRVPAASKERVDPVGFLDKLGITNKAFAQFLRERYKAMKDRKVEMFTRHANLLEMASGYEILDLHRNMLHRVDFMDWAPDEVGKQSYAVHWEPSPECAYRWKNKRPDKPKSLRIYECHVGISNSEPKISSFREFSSKVLPHVKEAGYNAIQLIGVPEHKDYSSVGYKVTNFFAVSSRFGTPEDFKHLVDEAHGYFS